MSSFLQYTHKVVYLLFHIFFRNTNITINTFLQCTRLRTVLQCTAVMPPNWSTLSSCLNMGNKKKNEIAFYPRAFGETYDVGWAWTLPMLNEAILV